MHHYRHHIGDYRKDTGHLTLIEHGVYRQALDLYYLREAPLPKDMRQLMRLLCANDAFAREALANVLADFFVETANGYEHARCDREIREFYDKSDKARESAKARWGGKKKKGSGKPEKSGEDAENMRTHTLNDADAYEKECERNANGMLPNYPTTQLPNKNITPSQDDGGGDENDSDYNAQKAAIGGKAAEPIPTAKKKRKRAVSAAGGSVATSKAGGKAAKYTPEQYQLAVWMSCPVKQQFPKQDIKLDEWAEACRKLIEIDGYTLEQIEWIWRQVTSDDRQGFNWSTNCRTPMKLRAKKDGLPYFEIIKNQFNRGKPDGTENRPAGDSQQSSGRENLQQRIRRQTTEWANGQGVGQGEGSSTGS